MLYGHDNCHSTLNLPATPCNSPSLLTSMKWAWWSEPCFCHNYISFFLFELISHKAHVFIQRLQYPVLPFSVHLPFSEYQAHSSLVKHYSKCWRYRATTWSLPERANYPIEKDTGRWQHECVTEVYKARRVCPEEGITWSLTGEDCSQRMGRPVKAEKIQWFMGKNTFCKTLRT